MTEQQYHLLCPKCGYDRWSEDGFQDCPICEQDLLTPEEREITLKRYFDYRDTLIDKPIGDSLMVATEKQVLAKLKRLGWLPPEEVEKK